jgi:hypothetical protein
MEEMMKSFAPAIAAFGLLAAIVPLNAANAADTTIGGVYTVVITVDIESSIPANEPLTCTASLTTADAVYSNTVSSSSDFVRSGTTGTCTIALHYLFTVSSKTTTASLSFSVGAGSYDATNQDEHTLEGSVSTIDLPNSLKGNTTRHVAAAM